MSEPRIRLELSHAQTLDAYHRGQTVPTHALEQARRTLAQAVAAHTFCRTLAKAKLPALPFAKPDPADRKAKARREDAAQARKDRKVYRAVTLRAEGRCEHCGRPFGSGLDDKDVRDHFWGRGKEATLEETVWVLCGACNREKTDNVPTRAAWLRAFFAHCVGYRYREQADRCVRELEAERDIKRAAEVSRVLR